MYAKIVTSDYRLGSLSFEVVNFGMLTFTQKCVSEDIYTEYGAISRQILRMVFLAHPRCPKVTTLPPMTWLACSMLFAMVITRTFVP